MAEISTIPISTNEEERRGEAAPGERASYIPSGEWTGRQFCFGANGVISRGREGEREASGRQEEWTKDEEVYEETESASWEGSWKERR